jgi:hypothetical protein
MTTGDFGYLRESPGGRPSISVPPSFLSPDILSGLDAPVGQLSDSPDKPDQSVNTTFGFEVRLTPVIQY